MSTISTWGSILRFVGVALLAFVLDVIVFSYMHIAGVRVQFLLLCAICIGFRGGPVYGAVFGFLLGCADDALNAVTLGLGAGVCAACGYISAFCAQQRWLVVVTCAGVLLYVVLGVGLRLFSVSLSTVASAVAVHALGCAVFAPLVVRALGSCRNAADDAWEQLR